MLTVVSVIALASAVVITVIIAVIIAVIVVVVVSVIVSVVIAVIVAVVVSIVVSIVVPVVVAVVVSIMVIITNSSLIAMLRDAPSTQGNQGRRLLPLADTLPLGRIAVMHIIAFVSDAHDRTADVPAASRDIVVVEGFAQGKTAREHDAGEGKQVLDAHGEGFEKEILEEDERMKRIVLMLFGMIQMPGEAVFMSIFPA